MRFLFFLFAMAFLATPVLAATYTGPGSNQPREQTVSQALKMPDDTMVTLAGRLVSKIGKEKFLFQDATGTMTVEIDDEEFRQLGNVDVTPDTVVRITGEVDKEILAKPEIDVKRIEIVN